MGVKERYSIFAQRPRNGLWRDASPLPSVVLKIPAIWGRSAMNMARRGAARHLPAQARRHGRSDRPLHELGLARRLHAWPAAGPVQARSRHACARGPGARDALHAERQASDRSHAGRLHLRQGAAQMVRRFTLINTRFEIPPGVASWRVDATTVVAGIEGVPDGLCTDAAGTLARRAAGRRLLAGRPQGCRDRRPRDTRQPRLWRGRPADAVRDGAQRDPTGSASPRREGCPTDAAAARRPAAGSCRRSACCSST